MTSTSLITSAAVFCSLLAALAPAAEKNYSLWPRRPAELEQARRLIRNGQAEEAIALLAPYVGEPGIAGREARQITSAVNVRRYLTRQHPKAHVITIKRGDTLASLAVSSKCPTDVIMLLNGTVQPSSLKIGQKLVLVPMELRMEIHPSRREISVWDGDTLVADYDLTEVTDSPGKENEETTVASRDAFMNDGRVAARSPHYTSADKVLVLSNGQAIASTQRVEGVAFRMNGKDLNEMVLLLATGARVSIVRDHTSFQASEGAKR